MNQKHSWLEYSVLCSLSLFISTTAHAQITPDNTLGTESSRLTPNVQIKGAAADSISGGAQRGGNLFHSFSQFNVGNGQRVYFVNPGVQNILTRVTGGQASNILGTLGVDIGNANLFLLNPNGIVFGPNARLDVGGSFVGTTASAFRFGEQGVFSATNPEAPALLTVNPSALLFNQLNPGAIANQGFLSVPLGKNLLLVGGNVQMDEGELYALGGRVEIGAVEGVGSVGLNADGSLSFPSDLPRADVSLNNQSTIDVRSLRSDGGGNVTINARNLDIVGGSNIRAGILFGGTRNTQAGDIILNTTGTLRLAQQSIIDNSVFPGFFLFLPSIGNGGNIQISTASLDITDGSKIIASTGGQGNAGNVIVQARDRISLDGNSFILSDVERLGKGKGGNIELTTGSLSLTNSAQLSASTYGKGDSGNITINAREVYLDRINPTTSNVFNGIFSTVEPGAEGNSGNITINTNSLSVTNDGEIVASTSGKGNAGNVIINARDRVLVNRSDQSKLSIYNVLYPKAVGRAGNIEINTGSLSINKAQLQTSTGGKGDAGNITINARDTITLDDSSIASKVILGAEGNGGNIDIRTGSLFLTGGSQIDSSTFGQGDAGNISLNARDTMTFDGSGPLQVAVDSIGFVQGDNVHPSGVFSTVGQLGILKQPVGNGGNIEINTGSLFVTNGAQLLAEVSNGRGNAGNIIINARDRVVFDGTSQRTASGAFGASAASSGLIGKDTVGKGGNIEITTGSLLLSNNAELRTNTEGQGDAGSVIVRARDRISLDNADITSSVSQNAVGKGGNITLNARDLISLRNEAALVSSTAGQGDAGAITLNAGDRLTVDDSNILSRVTSNGQGTGGTIFMTSRALDLNNRAVVSVSSFGSGESGKIQVQGETLQLNNRSEISAETTTRSGGNIFLSVDDILLLRKGSLISTTAGAPQVDSNGGNITINAKAIIAVPKENSDISANAFQGRGGNITINTNALFGIVPASFPTSQSDITASSELGVQGQIDINQPEIQRTQGIIELPSSVVDATTQIAQICPRSPNAKPLGEFIITGRGSLQPNPLEPLAGKAELSRLATLDEEGSGDVLTRGQGDAGSFKASKGVTEIVEAQGWVKDSDGNIMLVAFASQVTPYTHTAAIGCPVSRH
ncbi:hypothetical protein BZZ01_15580 [Nostocales cyanobacterium HT-58-2]|nr:hypothetical protein BZZ01_15580 [Nostocales cyanobacterium HT-58-2]